MRYAEQPTETYREMHIVDRTELDTLRLHERLARRLARDVVSGRLAEGAVVPSSEELAAGYGVSRTVAREALQALSAAGLISVHHGKRTVVAPLAEWRFLEDLVKYAVSHEQPASDLANDLMETRIVLETAAAKQCAARASDDLLSELVDHAETCLERHRESRETPSSPQSVEDDLKFHRLVATGSGNRVLANLVTDIRRELMPTWALDRLTHGDMIKVWEEHLALARALQKRDADGAEAAAREHLLHSIDTTLKRALPQAAS